MRLSRGSGSLMISNCPAQTRLKSMLKQYSIQINVWARAKVIDSIIHILEQFRPIAKDGLKDPDMC